MTILIWMFLERAILQVYLRIGFDVLFQLTSDRRSMFACHDFEIELKSTTGFEAPLGFREDMYKCSDGFIAKGNI
ncbi:hypothetical protein NG791_01095 [Laspinema sp. D1]|uniref:hypothetical protein n=1 Tax=Laspinema palackyanum TaxID=3231601 RepID=UPI0034991567|nr:hypothetical protein [Laspinema sp. D2b]